LILSTAFLLVYFSFFSSYNITGKQIKNGLGAKMKNKRNTILNVLIGVVIFAVVAFLLPKNHFSREAAIALATLAVMVYWWITRPVHIAVTALLPIVINSVFSITPMGDVLANYFSPIVVLLIGSNVLIACWIYSGLDRRIALKSLSIIGTGVKKQLLIWFLLSTILSMFLPNAVVAASLCPIAAAMVQFSTGEEEGVSQSKTLYLILIAIVWGAGLGGFGTPLGGAMNLVAINHIESMTGEEYMYITWTLKMLPYLSILAVGTCVYLLLIKTQNKRLLGSKEYFVGEYKKMGKAKRSEKISLVLFIIAVLLAFTRPLYQNLLPEFKPFYGFLLMGSLAFFLNGEKGKKLITWDFAVKKINWGLIILFSGGLAVGKLIISTGAAGSIAGIVASLSGTNIFVIILLFVFLGMFLANASSNTAATAVLVPIVITITISLGLEAMPYIYIAAAACNCAYILPTSIRAIPVGFGLDVNYMFNKGLIAVVISFALLSIAAYANILLF